ncbi:MAG: hypothetical protein JWN04_6069 [Myxococcaceae bacterium]|nr:hypothetical protein [Myxococcaceae bacterium]
MRVTAEADPLLDRPCLGFSVLAWLPRQPRWQALQGELARSVPLPLALTPSAQMHISIQLLIPVRAERGDKEAVWQTLDVEARRELRACAELSSFTLVFDQLRILERAIILVARENDVVREVRDRFVKLLARAHMPAPRHDIVHTTLARYRASGEFEAPQLRIETTHVRISSIHLVRERSYGLGDYDGLAQSTLQERWPR